MKGTKFSFPSVFNLFSQITRLRFCFSHFASFLFYFSYISVFLIN